MEQTLEMELEDDFERMPHNEIDNQNDELDEDGRNKDSVEVIEAQSSILKIYMIRVIGKILIQN